MENSIFVVRRLAVVTVWILIYLLHWYDATSLTLNVWWCFARSRRTIWIMSYDPWKWLIQLSIRTQHFKTYHALISTWHFNVFSTSWCVCDALHFRPPGPCSVLYMSMPDKCLVTRRRPNGGTSTTVPRLPHREGERSSSYPWCRTYQP